jgi:hypothetical protein
VTPIAGVEVLGGRIDIEPIEKDAVALLRVRDNLRVVYHLEVNLILAVIAVVCETVGSWHRVKVFQHPVEL